MLELPEGLGDLFIVTLFTSGLYSITIAASEVGNALLSLVVATVGMGQVIRDSVIGKSGLNSSGILQSAILHAIVKDRIKDRLYN